MRVDDCAPRLVQPGLRDLLSPIRPPGRLARGPVGSTRQGFVDADDIAAVTTQALIRKDHIGQVLPLTGPRALSFPEALNHIQHATGLTIHFDGTSGAYRESLHAEGTPDEVIDTLIENFSSAAAQGDTKPTGIVEEILKRPGKDFSTYAQEAAARGVWQKPEHTPAIALDSTK